LGFNADPGHPRPQITSATPVTPATELGITHLGQDEYMTDEPDQAQPAHQGRTWFLEELTRFNKHQADRSKALAEGDDVALVKLDEEEDYIYDELHQAYLNRNQRGPFSGSTSVQSSDI